MRKTFLQLVAMLVLILCTGCSYMSYTEIPDCALTVRFLSTGKSDSILTVLDDTVILVDTGDQDDFAYISSTLNSYGGRVDYLILTHFDSDHIGSAAYIIENHEVGEVLVPDYSGENREYLAMLSAVNKRGVKYTVVTDGYSHTTQSGGFEINAPSKDTYDDENNYSLITSIYCGDNSVLLMGDALKARCREFEALDFGSYDLIKIPHHGDYNKHLKEIFAQSKAKSGVITAASAETIEEKILTMANDYGIDLYATYGGEILFLSDGSAFSINQ